MVSFAASIPNPTNKLLTFEGAFRKIFYTRAVFNETPENYIYLCKANKL